MAADAAVGINDDLAAGQPRVALRPPHHEHAGTVDQHLRIVGQAIAQHGAHHMLDDVCAHALGRLLGMLRRHDDACHAHRFATLILDRDLRLAVRPQVRQRPILAHRSQLLAQLVGQGDRQRHHIIGFVGRVAEHHALITRTELILARTPSDMRRLLLDQHLHVAGLGVDARRLAVVADLRDRLARDLLVVGLEDTGDLAEQNHVLALDGGLTGYASMRPICRRIAAQDGIQNGVRNGVADLVRMSFGHRLRSERAAQAHGTDLSCS